MCTIFKKIIDGKLPAYRIFEDPQFIAFLDINPITYGHTLLIPKLEVDYFFDIEDHLLADLIITAKKISIAIKRALSCQRIAIKVYGFDIPHAHVHLIPANSNQDLVNDPKLELSDQKFQEIAEKIKKFI